MKCTRTYYVDLSLNNQLKYLITFFIHFREKCKHWI